MAQTERKAAVELLLRVAQHGAYRSQASGSAAPETVALASTVTRWRRYLRFLVAQFSHRPEQTLDPVLEQVLLLGTCELVIMNRPAFAAIDESVALAKELVSPKSAGFVNGVLRNVVRAKDALPEPATGDEVRDLAIRWSHPTWLVRRYVARMGTEHTIRLLQANNGAPTHYVRVNTQRCSVEETRQRFDGIGVQTEVAPWMDNYLRVSRIAPLVRSGVLRRGDCAVHDLSAGLVVHLLDPKPGEFVLDTSAAPGGKATAIAARMQDSGIVQAWDRHPRRLELVRQAAAAQGLSSLRSDVQDVREADRIQADRVLVDAPCTGTGVLAKRADARWTRKARDLAQLISLQDELLDAAAAQVKPGGILVYSTCSIEPEENEERVSAFLARTDGFRLVPANRFLPSAVTTPQGHLQTLPHHHNMDGAFAAHLIFQP